MRIIIPGLLFTFAVSNYFEFAAGSDDSSPERYKSLNRDIYPKTRPLRINTSRRESSTQSRRSSSTTESKSPTPRRRLYPRHDGNGDIVESSPQKRRFSPGNEKNVASASQPLNTLRRPSVPENEKNVASTNQPPGTPRRPSPTEYEKNVASTNQPPNTPRRPSPSENEKNVAFSNQAPSTPRRRSSPSSEKYVDSTRQSLGTPRIRSSPGSENHSFTPTQPGTSRISPSIREHSRNENNLNNKDPKPSNSHILYYGTKNRTLDVYTYPEYTHPRRPQGTIIIDEDKKSEPRPE